MLKNLKQIVSLIFLSSCASTHPTATTASLPAKIIDWDRYKSSVILKTYRDKATFICSAVMISKSIGLTTAHCLAKSSKNEVIAGPSLSDPAAAVLPVIQKSIRTHPDYDPKKSLSQADLAIFKVKGELPLESFPVIPHESQIDFKIGQPLDRMSFGLRNGSNSRTWTEVFFEKVDGGVMIVTDALSVNGDSGAPLFVQASAPGQLQLVGIHTTLLEPSHLAFVNLAHFKTWIQAYK